MLYMVEDLNKLMDMPKPISSGCILVLYMISFGGASLMEGVSTAD